MKCDYEKTVDDAIATATEDFNKLITKSFVVGSDELAATATSVAAWVGDGSCAVFFNAIVCSQSCVKQYPPTCFSRAVQPMAKGSLKEIVNFVGLLCSSQVSVCFFMLIGCGGLNWAALFQDVLKSYTWTSYAEVDFYASDDAMKNFSSHGGARRKLLTDGGGRLRFAVISSRPLSSSKCK